MSEVAVEHPLMAQEAEVEPEPAPVVPAPAPPLASSLAPSRTTSTPGLSKASLLMSPFARSHVLYPVKFFGRVAVEAPSSSAETIRHIQSMRANPPPDAMQIVLGIPRLAGGQILLLTLPDLALLVFINVPKVVFSFREGDCMAFTTHVKQQTYLLTTTPDAPFGMTQEQYSAVSLRRAVRLQSSGLTRLSESREVPNSSSPTMTAMRTPTGGHGVSDQQHARFTPQRSTPVSALSTPDGSHTAAKAVTPNPGNDSKHQTPTSSHDRSIELIKATGGIAGSLEDITLKSDSARASPTPSESATSRLSVDSSNIDLFFSHLFEFSDAQVTTDAMMRIANAFGRMAEEAALEDLLGYDIDVAVSVCEDDHKGSFSTCPLQKDAYKLRQGFTRRIVVTATQLSPQLNLLDSGSAVILSEADDLSGVTSTSLDVISMNTDEGRKSCTMTCAWPAVDGLLVETPKDSEIGFKLSVDMMMYGLKEPVRFQRTFKVRVHKATERFWYPSKRDSLQKVFKAKLTVETSPAGLIGYTLAALTEKEDVQQSRGTWLLNKVLKGIAPGGAFGTHGDEEGTTGGDTADRPLTPPMQAPDSPDHVMSGHGTVGREISESTLESWSDVISKWDVTPRKRVQQLVRKGIPQVLRSQVWQKLANVEVNDGFIEEYRLLLTKECAQEQVITVDLHRTFPGHEFFRDRESEGQKILFNINKAYANLDTEIGYCQGMSFISAALLLNMPEEEAFALFVKIMYEYGLRDLFKENFKTLHLIFYQLKCSLEDALPDLYAHFRECGIEVHMFASQWFLTLFSVKFALPVVYHIMDLFLSEGLDILFGIALAMLKNAKRDLLAMPFEDILLYFRVQLPRVYMDDQGAVGLIQSAVKCKPNDRKLKKYEADYLEMKAKEEVIQDPVLRLEKENQELKQHSARLETESDKLASDLTAAKQHVDELEHANKALETALVTTKAKLERERREHQDDNTRLEAEAMQIKDMYRKSLLRSDNDKQVMTSEVDALKQVAASLNEQYEDRSRSIQTLTAENAAMKALLENKADAIELQQRVHQLELELAKCKLKISENEFEKESMHQQLAHLKQQAQPAAHHAADAQSSDKDKKKWFGKLTAALSS
eukprot:m.667526 g.667526  ORF g.667526 m.667526 type:complete len:1114 (-) comp58508_c0_seq12:310-3651(-)